MYEMWAQAGTWNFQRRPCVSSPRRRGRRYRKRQSAREEQVKFGRIVGTVTCEGRDIGEWMVRQGLEATISPRTTP